MDSAMAAMECMNEKNIYAHIRIFFVSLYSQPTAAWEWVESAGCPSGGDYADNGMTDTCEPYTLPPCAHHTTNSSYPACPSNEYHTPLCSLYMLVYRVKCYIVCIQKV